MGTHQELEMVASRRARHPSCMLSALLVAIVLVFVPTSDGVSHPEAPAALSELGNDFPDFLEIGEGAEKNPMHMALGAHKAKQQQALRTIDKLMKQPIIDPRQAKMYKKSEAIVEKVEKHIKDDLMDVVQMRILTERVNEGQAKKAMGLAVDVDRWALSAGKSVTRAAQSDSGGVGCQDSHPGLCAGVQVQGHCGIQAYAKACPLSCHMCAMPAKFRMGNSDERFQKVSEERGGKAAEAKIHAKFEAKNAKFRQDLNKKILQLNMGKAKMESAQKKVDRTRQKQESMKHASEKEAKSDKKALLKAKAKVKVDEDRATAAKNSKNAKLAEFDESPLKEAMSFEKEAEVKTQASQKEVVRLQKKKKKDKQMLADLEKKKGGVEAAYAKVRSQKNELLQQKSEAVAAKALAEKLLGKERFRIKTFIEHAAHEDKLSKHIMLKHVANVKAQEEKTQAALVVTRANREKVEVLNKSEAKRIQEMTVPGEERKVKQEALKANKDVMQLRQKFQKDAVKYAHLGLKWNVPASMEHAYARAKLAKVRVEGFITQLNAENNSPEAQKLKTMEVEAKEKMSVYDVKSRGLKKMTKAAEKEMKAFESDNKKRMKENKRQLGVSTKRAQQMLRDAQKKEKADLKSQKQSEKKVEKDEDAAAKDAVSETQVLNAEKNLERDRMQTDQAKREIKRGNHKVMGAKTKVIVANKAKAKSKAKATTDLVDAMNARSALIAKESASLENAKVSEKIAAGKFKEIKKEMEKEKDTEEKLEESDKKFENSKQTVVKLGSEVDALKETKDDLQKGESRKEEAGEENGEAKTEAMLATKEEAKAEKKAEEKSAEAKAGSAAKLAGLSGEAAVAAKEKAKSMVDKAAAQVKKGEYSKIKQAERDAARKAASGGGTVDKAVKQAEEKAVQEAKEQGEDPKKAKKQAKKKVLEAVDKAKEDAKQQTKAEVKEAVREAESTVASKVVDSATTAMLNVAKEAIANVAPANEQNTPQSTDLPDPDDCASNHVRQDQHQKLCATVLEQGHCGLQNYKIFCQKTCNPCEAGSQASQGAPGQADSNGDDHHSGGPSELKDSSESGIAQLEDQLSNSIVQANKAMHHAHKTEEDTKRTLSDGPSDNRDHE